MTETLDIQNATNTQDSDIIYKENFGPAKGGTATTQFELRINRDEGVAVFEVICCAGNRPDDKVITVSRSMSSNDLRGMSRLLELAAEQLVSKGK